MGCTLDFVVDLVEEHVDLGGSQFSESIVERWYSAHPSQWNVVVLEFWSPCLLHSFTMCLIVNVGVPASWYTWGSSWIAIVSLHVRPDLSWVCSTLRLLLSSDECAWISSVSTGRPVLSEETLSSWKDSTSISWEREVSLPSCKVFCIIPDNESHRSLNTNHKQKWIGQNWIGQSRP